MEKKESALFGSAPKNISNYYKKLTKSDKTVLFIFAGLIILSLSLMGLLSTIRTYDSDLSIQECNHLRADDVRSALELQEENKTLAFIYAFSTPLTIITGAICLAWILHGVGFKVVGN